MSQPTGTPGPGAPAAPAPDALPEPPEPTIPPPPLPAAPAAPGPGAPAPAAAQGEDDDVTTIEQARKLRREHQQLRRRLADMEAAQTAQAEAALTEEQRRVKAVSDREAATTAREQRAVERLTVAAIKEAGATAGVPANRLALLPKLIDRSEVELDDEGEPRNVDALVKALLKEYPDFIAGPPAPAVRGSADGGSRGSALLTMEQIRAMTPDQINSRWVEITAALKAQQQNQ